MKSALGALVAALVMCCCPSAHATTATLPSGHIVFDGDSLSYMMGQRYSVQLAEMLGGWTSCDASVPGQTSAQMLASPPVGLLVAGRVNVVSAWIGTNDKTAPVLGDDTYANLVAYCGLMRAAGFRVMVFTVLPRRIDPSLAWASGRVNFNGLLRSNWRTFADYFVDVAADPRLNAWSAYFDGVHLTDDGYGIVASLAYDALQYRARHPHRGRHQR